MKAALPFLLGAAAAAAPACAAETIAPGYWESTNEMLSPIHTKSVEKRCLTPADIEKFMMGPSNRHYTCTYPTRSFEGGRILLDGSCVSKKGQTVKVQGAGDYDRTSFTLTATVATEIIGIPVSGKMRTEARRIAEDCPPPDAPPG
jgi:hypothetical protein